MKKRKKKISVAVKTKHPPSVELAVNCIHKGYSSTETLRQLTEFRKGLKLSVNAAIINYILAEAKKSVNKQYDKDKGHVVSLHVERYNRDIELILNMDNPFEKQRAIDEGEIEDDTKEYDKVDWPKVKAKLINHYFIALSTMFNKEKVLQMHSKGYQILISNRLNVSLENKEKIEYDLTKLSMEEKVDFLHLVMKAKKNDFENGSVILRPVEDETETIDISHVVVEEPANIEKIKLEEPEPVPIPRTGTALIDVNTRLAEAFRKKAEEDMKNAGSKIN